MMQANREGTRNTRGLVILDMIIAMILLKQMPPMSSSALLVLNRRDLLRPCGLFCVSKTQHFSPLENKPLGICCGEKEKMRSRLRV